MFLNGPGHSSYTTTDPRYDAVAGAMGALGYDVCCSTLGDRDAYWDKTNDREMHIALEMCRLDKHCVCGVHVDFERGVVSLMPDEDVHEEETGFGSPEELVRLLGLFEAKAFERLRAYMAR